MVDFFFFFFKLSYYSRGYRRETCCWPFFIRELVEGGGKYNCPTVLTRRRSRAFCHKCKKREKAFWWSVSALEKSVARGAWQSPLHAGRMREIWKACVAAAARRSLAPPGDFPPASSLFPTLIPRVLYLAFARPTIWRHVWGGNLFSHPSFARSGVHSKLPPQNKAAAHGAGCRPRAFAASSLLTHVDEKWPLIRSGTGSSCHALTFSELKWPRHKHTDTLILAINCVVGRIKADLAEGKRQQQEGGG